MRDDPRNWCDVEIKFFFDHNFNVTLAELARMTGKTVKQLKKILMG
mgnify:CR=1 FL=1|jgi:hypothetical protein|tara:strand:- start:742 stop:879 length:138 start_codon:yes stop_codon:yes gene_type:complete